MKRMGPLFCLMSGAFFHLSPLALAQGGPPFRSDDPDTPGNKLWEINTILIGSRNPAEGSYETPNVDINYGLGNRVQLKYEIPVAIYESRVVPRYVAAGLGNSLLGVKWRIYAHHPRTEGPDGVDKRESNFGISIYPQVALNNPTRSVQRGIADPGPQLLIPVEVNAKIGPIHVSGELGYWFTSKDVPHSWIRGVIVGHEFRNKVELSVEIFDQQAAKGTGDEANTHDSTVGVGGRVPISRHGSVWFIGMIGRSLTTVTRTNGQPSWIASAGFQFLTGGRRRHSSD